MDIATILGALASGVVSGLILGLVGGGGSILAVPLLVYIACVSMLGKRGTAEARDVRLTRDSAATLLSRLVPTGLGVGLAVVVIVLGGYVSASSF